MKRKIFIRIFAATALVLILFLGASVAIMNINAKKMLRQRLSTETYLVTHLVDGKEDFEAFNAYFENDELRVTIIDAKNGDVLFESDTKAALETHFDREEVQYALQGNPQAVERYSETFECTMTYFAVTDTMADGTQIVVRLALRGSEMSSYLLASLPFFLVLLIVAVLVAIVLADKISRNVSAKVTEVGDSLKSLNAGEYMPLNTDTTEPEFYSLFNEINELNESTHEYIRRQENEHRKLNAVLDNVAQGIVALNAKGEIVFVNGSALRLFGGDISDEGRALSYLVEDARLTEEILSRLTEKEFVFEYEFSDKILSVVGKKIEETSDEKGLSDILIFTDVTAAKEIIRQKSEFFANASHELKTPITVMRGLTEILMEKEGLAEQEKKQIDRIHKESLRMSSLISDMLKLSKLERSEEEERITVDLREVAQEVVSELAEETRSKNLTVTLKGEGKVLADPKKIFELIQNLCSNAVNYNKQDGLIEILIAEKEDAIFLEVADSGIGIEKEHLPRLCERFYRVDKSRSKKTGGTGLGLAIVKHICALYGAELSIESRIGVGTRVTVLFKK